MNRLMEEVSSKKETTVKDFLEVIFRRKWVIIGIVSIAVILVFVSSVRKEAMYESSAKLLLKRGEIAGVFSRDVRTLKWEEEIASQIELMKSQLIIERASETVSNFLPENYKTSEKLSLGRVNSDVVTTSNVIWVTYLSPDPRFAEAAVNAIVTAYRNYYVEARTPPEMDDFFTNEIEALEKEMEYWRVRREKMKNMSGIIDLRDQKSTTIQQLSSYKRDLVKLEQDLSELEIKLSKLKEVIANENDVELSGSVGLLISADKRAIFDSLKRQLMELEVEEAKLATRLTENNRELVRVKKQISSVRKLIEREIKEQIHIYDSQIAVINSKVETLRELVKDLNRQKDVIPTREAELDRINVAMEQIKKSYDGLKEQRLAAKITKASHPEWTVTILNNATPAIRKTAVDYVRMALAPIFSLIVAVGLAFFIDNLDHSVKNVTEAEEVFKLPVLTSFPDMK
jgi:succinoglycan biosynthesis transport protein ExoP